MASKNREIYKAKKAQENKGQLSKVRKKQSGGKKYKRHDTRTRFVIDEDDWDFPADERIMPRTENERRKFVAEKAKQAPALNAAAAGEGDSGETVGGAATIEGLVVEVSSGRCRVDVQGELLLCSLRGALKNVETGYTNIVAVGDQVLVTLEGAGQGVVEAVLPRRSVLARAYSPDGGKLIDRQQVVVANVDQVLIAASWRDPNLWPELIDRYLIACQRNHLEAVLCVNKIDLMEDPVEFEAALRPYHDLGITLLQTSATTGKGIEELKARLAGKTTVLAGLSGVGKSSLVTALQPGLDLRAFEVNRDRHQGRHTTTQASLYKLDFGGLLVDTPGIRSFGLAGLERRDLTAYFPEIAEFAGKCKFGDCTHEREAACAVQAALAEGVIPESRYKSYRAIYAEL